MWLSVKRISRSADRNTNSRRPCLFRCPHTHAHRTHTLCAALLQVSEVTDDTGKQCLCHTSTHTESRSGAVNQFTAQNKLVRPASTFETERKAESADRCWASGAFERSPRRNESFGRSICNCSNAISFREPTNSSTFSGRCRRERQTALCAGVVTRAEYRLSAISKLGHKLIIIRLLHYYSNRSAFPRSHCCRRQSVACSTFRAYS